MKRILATTVLIVIFASPTLLQATSDDDSNVTITGLSKDGRYLALKISGANAAGGYESLMIKDLRSSKAVRSFELIDPTETSPDKTARIRRQAKLYLQEKGITKENFKKHYTALKKSDKNTFSLPRGGFVRLEERYYGDKVSIIMYDERSRKYRLLYKTDYNHREYVRKYIAPPGKYKETMENYPAAVTKLKAVYQKKTGPSALLIHMHHSYHMHGSQSDDMVFTLNSEKAVRDHYWSNVFGFRMYKKKKYDQAIAHFRESISAKPDYAVAIYNLACTYSLKNDVTGAVENLKKLRKLWREKQCRKARYYLKKTRRDSDFDTIRGSSEFIEVTKGL
jgi:tetratricopeptide (TPR) repeat protein